MEVVYNQSSEYDFGPSAGGCSEEKKHVSGSACFTFLAADLYGRKTTAVLEVLTAEAKALLHKMNNCLFAWAVIKFLL